MSPGHYLQLRRRAARLSVLATASALVALPAALRRATSREVNRMAERLHAAEADILRLTDAQVSLLANVIPLDTWAYLRLSSAYAISAPCALRICTECGCTDDFACISSDGPCAWSANRSDVCTACDDALMADLVAAASVISSRHVRRPL